MDDPAPDGHAEFSRYLKRLNATAMNHGIVPAFDALGSVARLIADPYYRVPADRGEEIADAMEMIHEALMRLERYLHTGYAFEEGRPADVIAYSKLLDEFREPCAEKLEYMLDRPSMFGNDPVYQYEADDLANILELLQAGCRSMLQG